MRTTVEHNSIGRCLRLWGAPEGSFETRKLVATADSANVNLVNPKEMLRVIVMTACEQELGRVTNADHGIAQP